MAVLVHSALNGQRKGLGIAVGRPVYVTAINSDRNEIVVGDQNNLLSKGLIADHVHKFMKEIPERLTAKIRSTSDEVSCKVYMKDEILRVIFDEPQFAITPGQSVVLYDGELVAGGGIIIKSVD